MTMTRASLKATLAYFIAAATFMSVAEIEGIHDSRASQVCVFFGAQLIAILLINDEERTWSAVLSATITSALVLVGLAASPVVVTPPYAWLFLAVNVLVACGLSWCMRPRS